MPDWKDEFTPEQLKRRREYQREYRRKKRAEAAEEEKRKAAEWRAANRGKVADYNRRQRERIKADSVLVEKDRARSRVSSMSPERAEAERVRKREYIKRRRAKAREQGDVLPGDRITPERRAKATQRQREWREQNPERARRNAREYMRKRRQMVRHAIDDNAFRAISHALDIRFRDYRSKYFPGYTGEDLRRHFAQFFNEEINLYTYGIKWEVDHIRPVAGFQYESIDDPQYRECWSLENLRPYCRIKNRSEQRR